MAKPKGNPPSKPDKRFPLWAHASGSWCAVIDGERRYFGGWTNDRKGEEAIARYDRFIEQRRGGLAPAMADSTATVRDVVNLYLTRQYRRTRVKDLSHRDYRDCMGALHQFVDEVGRRTMIRSLKPPHFGTYLLKLKEKLARSTIRRHVAHIKGMFAWAFDQEHIPAPPRFGKEFKAPAAKRSEKVDQSFSAKEVCMMLSAAPLPLRAMIRLGIECGFGNTDVASLKWEEIDMGAKIIDMIRGKTEIHRRCFISDELHADLLAWKIVQGRREVPLAEEGLAFTTKNGLRYVREVPSDDPKVPPRTVDSVAVFFDNLIRNVICIKEAGDGRSFYSLRRTHRTWSDELNDHHAAALVMGHARGAEIAGLYVQSIDDSRLKAINDHVATRLKQTQLRLDHEARGAVVPVAAAKNSAGRKRKAPKGRSSRSGARSPAKRSPPAASRT